MTNQSSDFFRKFEQREDAIQRTAPDPADDPFHGLFDDGPPEIAMGSLMDQPAARHWLATIASGKAEGLYTYQRPLASGPQPHVTILGRSYLMLSAYDYLGLSQHPAVMEGAIDAIRRHGVGTGGVRLLTGTAEIHRELEAALADFLGTGSALTFTSGYAANLGAITALLNPRDIAITDAAAHQSLVEGCRAAGAQLQRFRHNDAADLDRCLREARDARRKLVIIEGVYSMDGDVCRLDEILDVTERHGAELLIDESHSIGVIGPNGGGVVAHFGIDPARIAMITASLAKAIPAGGGVIAASRAMTAFLQHRAGPFIFSSALPPAGAGAAIAALRIVRADTDRHARLRRNAARLRNGLSRLGYDTGRSSTAIIPVICGTDRSAYFLARRLLEAGIATSAVVPPAVAPGQARLRLCATADLKDGDIDHALSTFAKPEIKACLGM